MYATVRLLNGFSKPLLYALPKDSDAACHPGTILHVPLKNHVVPALVLSTTNTPPHHSKKFVIREAVRVEPFPVDTHYHSFVSTVAALYDLSPLHFYQRVRSVLNARTKTADKPDTPFISPTADTAVTLTPEQQAVVDYLAPTLSKPRYAPTLLHGVTGSGKTEVYKSLMMQNLKLGKTTLFLLPEISLSLQFHHLFTQQLPPGTPLYSFHSLTTPAQRRTVWHRLVAGKPCIILGVHLPVLLPISNLGLIIIDEEHEGGFEEKKHPKIHSKHAAVLRAHRYKIPLLLGSATPSLGSLHNVNTRGWKLFNLTKRFSGTFPTIKRVSLRTRQRRKSFWITKELDDAIAQTVARKEQVIIYLNRRGFSFFVQCSGCGHTFSCNNCSVSFTLHRGQQHDILRCHYCNAHQPVPPSCPECKAPEKGFIKKGIGTQQLVGVLEEMFPNARIARADLDTTKKKRAWTEMVEQFSKGEIDILVGTQVITKGYHFPNVTLVGVIWGDLNLHFPVYNASEMALQKLIQVAGRAGRGEKPSTVIVQIMQEHDIFEFVDEQRYSEWCKREMTFREETGYPPCKRLLHLELKHTDPRLIDKEADAVADALRKQAANFPELIVLGPARPVVYRQQKNEYRQVFIKGSSFKDMYTVVEKLKSMKLKSSVFVTPTP